MCASISSTTSAQMSDQPARPAESVRTRLQPKVDPYKLANVREVCRSGQAKEIRLAHHLSLGDVSDAIHMSESTIHRWENGQRRPSGEGALRYLVLLNRLLEGNRPPMRDKHVQGMEYYDDPKFAELPPGKNRAKSRWASVVEKLKSHPGQWAEIGRHSQRGALGSNATTLRKAFPGIEVTTRWTGDDGRLWARWVGTE